MRKNNNLDNYESLQNYPKFKVELVEICEKYSWHEEGAKSITIFLNLEIKMTIRDKSGN